MNFKLTIYPAIEAGNPSVEFKFDSRYGMDEAATTSADLLLFLQDKAQVMPNYSNGFIKEQFIDGEWIELD